MPANTPARAASATPPTNAHDPSHTGHGHVVVVMSPTQRDALTLSNNDLAMHAGGRILGVSRYSEEDPDRSRHDRDSMHTFSAAPPDHENVHPADEHISSFLLSIRRRAEGEVAGSVLEAAPSDTRTGGAAYPTPGVAAPVVAADPGTDIDVGTAGGLLPDVVDFDPTSA